MGHSTCLSHLVLLLWLTTGSEADFETTLRVHSDFDPKPINMEIGWGATKCVDFQEVTTLFRHKTFEPALVVTCEMKSHQCISVRAVNSTHHYTFQGCVPQARVPKMCTEMALESAQENGAEYFYCYDVDHGRLNVPENAPLDGRECCCNADFCNRIENVRTMVSIIPHDEIHSPFWRMWHRYYQNVNRLIGIVSFLAIVIFSGMTLFIVFRPAQKDDDTAWYVPPVAAHQIIDDLNDGDDDDIEVVDVPTVTYDAKKLAEMEASKKKKKEKKKGKLTKEDAGHDLKVDVTQDVSEEQQEKTGQDDGGDKKQEKGPTKKGSKEGEDTEKEKKPAATDTTPIDANEKKTQGDDVPKKEEEKEKKEEEGKQFVLPKKPKKLANGRIQYTSMFNENSDYDED